MATLGSHTCSLWPWPAAHRFCCQASRRGRVGLSSFPGYTFRCVGPCTSSRPGFLEALETLPLGSSDPGFCFAFFTVCAMRWFSKNIGCRVWPNAAESVSHGSSWSLCACHRAKGSCGARPSVTAVLCVQGHFRIRKLGFERLVTGLPESGLPSTTLKCLPP